MYIDVEIGPYKVEQRTEYSKIKILNIKENKDISETFDGIKIAKKIIEDYKRQIDNKDEYFQMTYGTLNTITHKISEDDIKFLFIPKEVGRLGSESLNHANFEYICFPDNLKEIKESAFFLCTHLKEVFLPDSIKTIPDDVFKYCERLESIRLPNNIRKINEGTFSCCKSLKNIIIPESVLEIADYAFYKCEKLESIKLPKSLLSIGTNSFDTCTSLRNINLPDTLQKIGKEAFCDCVSLESIYIPDSVKAISERAFIGCENLENVKLSKNISKIERKTFKYCKKLKNITIPDKVDTLGLGIFTNTKSLENINIPKNLSYTNGSPFANSNIKSLTFNYDLGRCKHDLIDFSNIDKLIISKNVSKITPEAFKYGGNQITTIDYQGTSKEFEKFKNNNKKLFDTFTNLEKINFIEKEEEKLPIAERDNFTKI